MLQPNQIAQSPGTKTYRAKLIELTRHLCGCLDQARLRAAPAAGPSESLHGAEARKTAGYG